MRFKGIICFSNIDWNFLKQRTHYFMAGLAAKGIKVFFIENTGVRIPRIRDFSRVINRVKSAVGQVQAGDIPEGIDILSPLTIPLPYNNLAICYNERNLSKRIKKFLADNKISPPEVIFWSCLATPLVLKLMKSEPWGAKIYDIVSDPKFIEARLEPFEREMVSLADNTFFASATLYDEYYSFTKNPVLFKDGFNLELLLDSKKNPEVEALPRPRFVYVGGLNKKIQTDALASIAGYFKNSSVILIGPSFEDFKVPANKNIHIFPAQRHYRDLAGFLVSADIGLIPYYPDRYSGAMHPAKLNEYLVCGLPVVAAATPELKKLADMWGEGFFYLYDSPEKITDAVERALSEESPKFRKKRQDLTLRNTWGMRISDLLNLLRQS